MKSFILGILMLSCAHRSEPLKVSSWGIQLQGYEKNDSLKKIQNSEKDLWVIDPDSFTSSMVRTLRKKPKKIIAYLSLGEAEGYRDYFKSLPQDLLIEENPQWKDNFTVKFWDERWKKVVQESLQRIQKKGFDGVFLDVIDAFDRFPDKETKARAMGELIEMVAQEARKTDPGFLVIMQNGLHIRRLLSDPQTLLASISAVNAENVYDSQDAELLSDLAFYRQAGKLILGLEYLKLEKDKANYIDFAHKQDILPLILDESLDGTGSAY